MAVKVLYFAGLRETLGLASESVALATATATVGGLRDQLVARGAEWQPLAATRNLRAAVNQAMCSFDAPVADGDEVAFFPPVTGG
ncbi:MAG: molybdopterin converting factor subunit 1 [Rhodocyclaceae bacterium]|nr:molybdopterin converting factor subunit 1 [Rhodocyclaceae bacterium]